MKADLHVHTDHSADGASSLAQLLRAAKRKGLGAFAVTDHNSCAAFAEIAAVCDESGRAEGVLIVPGVELSTDAGHLLGLFLERPVEFGSLRMVNGVYPFRSALDEIHRAGGIASAAHPFEKAAGNALLLQNVKDIDAVECYNARTAGRNSKANRMAAELAASAAKPATAGSDAHFAAELGNAYVSADLQEDTLPALRAAVCAGIGKTCGVQSPERYRGISQMIKKYREKEYAALPKRAAVAAALTGRDCLRFLHILKTEKGQQD